MKKRDFVCVLFPFHMTMDEPHLSCSLLRHEEVGGFAFSADFALRIAYLCVYEEDVSHLLGDVCSDGQLRFVCRYGFAKLYVEAGREAACLHLTRYYPTACLVDECTQDTAMHRVHPSLEVAFGMPCAHDVVAVFVKLHVKAKGVVGRTAKAVIFRMPRPGVDDFLHFLSCLRI